ncbi:MAG: cation efflux protein [Microvirga sp.]|jgi:Co/Zn/Cd efflux system component|nr:cation efflux protein [Geminicoccaceae bacterium]MDF2974788.1 cation efflux protein [Microvirga sp.]
MADCCESKSCALEQLRDRQRGTLKAVLGINLVMFVVVFTAGMYASSTALLADSLDNLGDALTYGLSMYVVSRSDRAKGWVAMFKGSLILAAALFVIGQIVYKLLHPAVPIFEAMGVIGLLSLVANGTCLALLWKHRQEDVNMSSVWECSRNDIASNLAVIVAAGAVWAFGSGWPDILIGAALALLFLRSAARVFRGAFEAVHTQVNAR